MKIGIKNQFYPDTEQKALIEATFNNTRFIKNYFLAQRNTYWKNNKDLPKESRFKQLSSLDEINQIKSLKIQKFSIDLEKTNQLFENTKFNEKDNIDWMTINSSQFESLKIYWLNQGLSSALQQGLRDLNEAFQRFYKGLAKYPQFKKRANKQSFSLTVNNFCKFKLKKYPNLKLGEKLNIENYEIKLNKTSKPLKIKFDRDFDITKVTKFTISKNPSGQYFITFLANEELSSLKKKYVKLTGETGQTASIDVGVRTTATILTQSNIKNEDNTCLQKIEQKKLLGLKRYEKRLARAQRNLSRKVKGSKNRDKARIKVAKIYNNLVNYRTDFYHKLSTSLIENNDKIVIEDLNIKGMVKNRRLAKSISLQGWGIFFNMLEYKCQWYGKELVKADRFFASSKICSNCNQHNPYYGDEVTSEFSLSKYNKIPENWTCSYCETRHNRDENACKNLIKYDVVNTLDTKALKKKSTKNQSRRVNQSTAEIAGLPSGNGLGKDIKPDLLDYASNSSMQHSARDSNLLHPETV
jgi:putative transposase